MKAYEPDKPLVLIGQPSGNYPFFRDVMQQLFGKKFLDLSGRRGTQLAPWTAESARPDGRWLPQIDCLGGIFNAGAGNNVHRCCPADSQFILLVADPFSTAVDNYRTARIESDAGRFWMHGKQTHVDVHFRSINEYLEQYPRSIYDHLPAELTLETYEQQFSQRYVYIGPAENLQTSAKNIARVIGRPLESMPSVPKADENRSFENHLRSRFEHNFPLPIQIYNFAKRSATAFATA